MGPSVASPIVISLKPSWALSIVSGTKHIEFRRKWPRQAAPYPLFIYASAPRAALVARCDVTRVQRLSVDELIELNRIDGGPDSESELRQYFQGCDAPVAIHVGNPQVLVRALGLSELRTLGFCPPQNFVFAERYPELCRRICVAETKPFADMPWQLSSPEQ